MTPLDAKDLLTLQKALTYTNGYRELGMYKEAEAEMNALPERFQSQRSLLEMKLAVLMEAKRWRKALSIAKSLAHLDPKDPGYLVNLAYVTRRAYSLTKAKIILEEALLRFPRDATIHYNLGCYSAIEGDNVQAQSYLLRAFELDKEFLKMSQNDEDLAPLANWLKELSEGGDF